jgi:hypothetical protein
MPPAKDDQIGSVGTIDAVHVRRLPVVLRPPAADLTVATTNGVRAVHISAGGTEQASLGLM